MFSPQEADQIESMPFLEEHLSSIQKGKYQVFNSKLPWTLSLTFLVYIIMSSFWSSDKAKWCPPWDPTDLGTILSLWLDFNGRQPYSIAELQLTLSRYFTRSDHRAAYCLYKWTRLCKWESGSDQQVWAPVCRRSESRNR
jgi:hypothetical protein